MTLVEPGLSISTVIPAKAGIQPNNTFCEADKTCKLSRCAEFFSIIWIPAFAGMTQFCKWIFWVETTNYSTRLAAGYILCFLPFAACAADESRSAYTPPPPAVSSGSIMQIIFSLLLVLVAIVLVGWLLKRMNISQQGGGSHLKLLGGISIGQRERIVLVEVKDTWLVVGVGPGQIRTLHTLPKAEDEGQQTASAPSGASKFANLLSSFTKPQQTDTKQDAS